MHEQIIANMAVHLKFFRRNRLLLVVSLIFLGIMGLTMIPAFFVKSASSNFEILKMYFSQLNGFATLFSAALGLALVSSHLKNRNLKMVLTKPCLPEVWLLSGFLAAALISFAIFFILYLSAVIFSLTMEIPLQAGFAFISIENFMKSIILLSTMMFLSMAFHPVMAVLFALIFNEGTFFGIKTMLAAFSGSFGENWVLKTIEDLAGIMYMIVPMTSTLVSGDVYSSLRVGTADWGNLVHASVYSIAVSVLFLLLSDRILRSKMLI